MSSNEKVNQIMDQVRREIAMQNFRELIRQIEDKCFTKCITSPGTSLAEKEQGCLARCSDRYQDAWNVTSNVYMRRAQRQSGL
ncbi:Mitochondrial import inner membrane translocase subunit Tim13 [Rhizophlyctis rosea]|uniref:Mitochondrial import inner membrane translocase subunit n=1 Tax=Rhizophlyctis rosea TaxID=64517 RepID=A0AAD5X4L8_9FUNG|nr:Mitochondrial import inner membrane translocase subunit Tim13 [Rhizophlyctis rosea]